MTADEVVLWAFVIFLLALMLISLAAFVAGFYEFWRTK